MTSDVDDVMNEVQQMSLESIDMTSGITPGITTAVPGYCFAPDPCLLPGNFPPAVDFQRQYFNGNFADELIDAGSFPATIDISQLAQLNGSDAGDLSEFEDLITFQ